MFFIYYFSTGLLLTLPAVILMVRYHETEQDSWGPWVLSAFTVFLWPLMVPFVVYLWFHHRSAYNPVGEMRLAPDNQGYWLVDRKGNKHAFGSAIRHKYSNGGLYSYKPDEMTINPSGRILHAMDVEYFGDVFEQEILAPIVGVLPTELRDGYYIFTEAGEVFAFGKAKSYGSLAEVDPTQYGISWRGYRKAQQQLEATETQTPIEPRAAVAPA